MFIPKDKVEWKKVLYLKNPLSATDEEAEWDYQLWLPEPLASWDVFSYWERERIECMRENLKKGEVLFDIGTESGWCNIIYADMVGPENMVLIEPTREFWGNIITTWNKHFKVPPLHSYWGLFSDKTRSDYEKGFNIWQDAQHDDLIDKNKYQYIHSHSEDITSIELDAFVSETGIIPDAITIDVEGAEWKVFSGAELTLKTHKPKLFISIHPDLMKQDYKKDYKEFIKYIESFGYKGKYLAKDHELHYFFEST